MGGCSGASGSGRKVWSVSESVPRGIVLFPNLVPSLSLGEAILKTSRREYRRYSLLPQVV